MESYKAVLCKFCNQPIPISATAATIEEEVSHGQLSRPLAFPARCRVCEHENIYEIGEIQAWNGEPRKRGRARAAGH